MLRAASPFPNRGAPLRGLRHGTLPDHMPGWEPVADDELRQIRQQLKLMVPRAAVVATVTATPRPVIVKARKPRPRR
jgi:hypothetical protein